MKRNLAIILTLALFACNSNTPKTPMTKPVENITATKDQQERRNKSEVICETNNIPVYSNPNSLFVNPEEKVILRTKNEVVDRALALCYIGLKSEGLEQELLDKLEKDYVISAKFSPKEREYATASQPTDQQKMDANWKYECLHVMLWALGYIDTLSYPDQVCDVAKDIQIIHNLTEAQFRQKATLRSKSEILDQSDLILRLDWACVNARINNETAPGRLNAEVVYERHYALNWLIKYMDQNWDGVTTDT